MNSKNGFFQPDNPFFTILTRVFDLLLLNILCLICSLPVITAGAAFIALYTVIFKWMRNEDPPVVSAYFAAFRENLKKGCAMGAVFLIIFLVLGADLHIIGHMHSPSGSLFYGVILMLLAAAVSVAVYAFPLAAWFENTVRSHLGNAWRLAVTHLPQTVIIAVLHLFPVLWFLLSPETFFAAAFLWGIIGAAVIAYFSSWFLAGIFLKLEKQAGPGDQAELEHNIRKERRTP